MSYAAVVWWSRVNLKIIIVIMIVTSLVILFVADSDANAWYKGCYEISADNTLVSVGFATPVDCGEACLDRG